MKNGIHFLLILLLTSTLQQEFLAQTPKTKWKFNTQGAIRGAAILDNQQLIFGNSAGIVYAIDKNTGQLNWQYQTSGTICSSPALSGDIVYVASRDNYLYAIDKHNGQLKWKFQMQPMIPAINTGWAYFMAAPQVWRDKVYIGSGDANLYALDKNSGELRWKFKTEGRIRATPLIHEGKIYQPSNDSYLYVLDAESGKLEWKFATLGVGYAPGNFSFDRRSMYDQPTIQNGHVIFGSRDGNVYSVDLQSHESKWNFSYGTTWAMATAADESNVYAGWSTNNMICALDLSSGEKKWEFQCKSHSYTKPLLLDNAVYMGSADGKVYKLNKQTGELQWAYPTGGEVYSSLLHENGTLYFGSDDGYFYALEEAPRAHKAVYLPKSIVGNAQYLVADPQMAPYFTERGFDQLNENGLADFVRERIADREPSVVVFALPLIPKELMGADPAKGLMRKYLESGGKILWMGDVPNFYEPDESDNFKRDPASGSALLSVSYTAPTESGNYYSQSTQAGLCWGLPSWFKTTGALVAQSSEITPLAYNEFGKVSAWVKKFHPRIGSGFVSCRTWAWNVPIRDHELEILYNLAVYGLN